VFLGLSVRSFSGALPCACLLVYLCRASGILSLLVFWRCFLLFAAGVWDMCDDHCVLLLVCGCFVVAASLRGLRFLLVLTVGKFACIGGSYEASGSPGRSVRKAVTSHRSLYSWRPVCVEVQVGRVASSVSCRYIRACLFGRTQVRLSFRSFGFPACGAMSIEGAEWFSYAVLRHAVPALSIGSAMFLASRVGQVGSGLALLHCPFPGRHLAWLWCIVRFLVVFWLFCNRF
jgi:hypothetical protein